MKLLGLLDASLVALALVATGLLFSSGEVLGWGGIIAVTPWVARAGLLFATNQPTLPVRFGPLGNAALWRVGDISIMVLWLLLAGLTFTVFVMVSISIVFGMSGSFDPQLITPFGITAVMMMRVGVPLVLVGVGSCKDMVSGSPSRRQPDTFA